MATEQDLGLIRHNGTGDYMNNYYSDAHAITVNDNGTYYLKITGIWRSMGNSTGSGLKVFSTNINVGKQTERITITTHRFFNTQTPGTSGGSIDTNGYVDTDGTLYLPLCHENRYYSWNQYDYDSFTTIELNPVTYTVSVSQSIVGAGTIIGAGSYLADSPVTLTAIAKSRYIFLDWLLKGYTRLEYIESSGTQWIDSGYAFNRRDLKYEFKFIKYNKSTTNTWGLDTTSGARYMHGNLYNDLIYCGNASTGQAPITLGDVYEGNIEITSSGISATLNSQTYGPYNLNGWDGTTYNDYIFGTNRGSGINYISILRIYYLKFYQENILVRDFIPVIRHIDGAIGLLDLVNLKFYGNSGTGKFIGGEVV